MYQRPSRAGLDQQLEQLKREAVLNPESSRAKESLFWAYLRAGREVQALTLLYKHCKGLRALTFENWQETWATVLKPQPKILSPLMDVLWRGSKPRASRVRALVDAIDFDGDSEARQVALVVKRILTRMNLRVLKLSEFLSTLQRLARGEYAPKRGLRRVAFLLILRGGLGPEDELDQDDFGRRIRRGFIKLSEAYRFEWGLDDAHIRRYMVEHQMIERNPRGERYRLSERVYLRFALSSHIQRVIDGWWRLGPEAERLRASL